VLAGHPGAVRAGRADEDPVELGGRLLDEHDAGGLALHRLGPVLLRELSLHEPRLTRRRAQRAEPADLEIPRSRLGADSGELGVHLDQPASHVAARGQGGDHGVGAGDDPPGHLLGGADLVADPLDGFLRLRAAHGDHLVTARGRLADDVAPV